MNPHLKRMIVKGRYVRNGTVMLNLLKYDLIWVANHMGYLGKENTCKYLQFVSSLLQDDLNGKPKSSKKGVLPGEASKSVAKDMVEKPTDNKEKEI